MRKTLKLAGNVILKIAASKIFGGIGSVVCVAGRGAGGGEKREREKRAYSFEIFTESNLLTYKFMDNSNIGLY